MSTRQPRHSFAPPQLKKEEEYRLLLRELAQHMPAEPVWQQIGGHGNMALLDAEGEQAWLLDDPHNRPLDGPYRDGTALTFWLDADFVGKAGRPALREALDPYLRTMMRLAETDKLGLRLYAPEEPHGPNHAVGVVIPAPASEKAGMRELYTQLKKHYQTRNHSSFEEQQTALYDRHRNWGLRMRGQELPGSAIVKDVMQNATDITAMAVNDQGKFLLTDRRARQPMNQEFLVSAAKEQSRLGMEHTPRHALAVWLTQDYDVPLYQSVDPEENSVDSASVQLLQEELHRLEKWLQRECHLPARFILRPGDEGDRPVLLVFIDGPHQKADLTRVETILQQAARQVPPPNTPGQR